MTRIEDIDEQSLSPAQRDAFEAIAGSRGKVGGPLRVWINSPELANRAQHFGAFCRYHSSLSPKLSELAILVTAAQWQADYEWESHRPIALEAGVAPEIVEAIRTGARPVFEDEAQAAVYDFAVELHATRAVSAETYDRTFGLLGKVGIVDLVGIIGYYSFIAMTCVAFDIDIDAGKSPFA